MSIYTNTGLVTHVKMALALSTKYMWGGILKKIDTAYINALRSIYGVDAAKGYTEARYAELRKLAGKGVFGCDCIGLIKSYYWSGKENGGTGSPKYGAAGFPDVNAGMMYSAAKVKGTIDTMPEIPGLIVYCRSHPHVGVYIGDGWVIECTLSRRGDGVVKTRLKDWTWEHWFQCPYISYETGSTAVSGETKTYRLAYPAVVREEASSASKRLDRLVTGRKVNVVLGSETEDKKTGFTYVKIIGNIEGWITKSALG